MDHPVRLPPRATAPAPCRRRWREVLRDSRGATLIEFAFVAGPFMALIIAVLQVSLTFFAQQTLESAGEIAARQLLVGGAQKAGMNQEQYTNLVCSKLPGFMKCKNVMVDVQVATAFSAANTAPPTVTFKADGTPSNVWQYQPGVAGDIVVVKTMYIWDVRQGPLGFDLSTLSNGKRLLIATSVFKTEGYS